MWPTSHVGLPPTWEVNHFGEDNLRGSLPETNSDASLAGWKEHQNLVIYPQKKDASMAYRTSSPGGIPAASQ